MATRTNKLYGKVWGDPANPATIVVHYNNQQVFSGPVPTVIDDYSDTRIFSWENFDELCSWTTESSVSGTIPVRITINGGGLRLFIIKMNYMYYQTAITLKSDANWVAHVPSTAEELQLDINRLTSQQFLIKYGVNKTEAMTNVNTTIITPIEDNFVPPFSCPGHEALTNVRIDSIPKSVDVTQLNPDGPNGAWHWVINNGSTIEFDYSVAPAGT